MPYVRPISALGPHIEGMADRAQAANAHVVKQATFGLRTVVANNGGRHHIRGRSGKMVALGAKADVLLFGATPVGQVQGFPEGFWSIVEHGAGAHKISRRKTTRRSGPGKMLSTPYGPRWSVNIAAQGPHGKPWATSMVEGEPVVQQILAVEQTLALVKQWN